MTALLALIRSDGLDALDRGSGNPGLPERRSGKKLPRCSESAALRH
jgi:hypothetical protein